MIDEHDPRVIRNTTLLDWFAGQALTGLLSSETESFQYGDNEKLCEAAWDIAELMLNERIKRTGQELP